MTVRVYDRAVVTEFSDHSEEQLLHEMKSRGYTVFSKEDNIRCLIEKIYLLRRCGEDYQKELDQLIDSMIGRY